MSKRNPSKVDRPKNEGRKPAFSVTLDDCEIQDLTCSGPGGQHVNKAHTGIRIIHKPSGARGECREERSQLMNKRKAFRRMTEHALFKLWVNRQLWYRGESPEQRVEKDMKEKNLRVEVRDDGKWTEAE